MTTENLQFTETDQRLFLPTYRIIIAVTKNIFTCILFKSMLY